MSRYIHIITTLVMLTAIVNSVFTRGPVMEAASYKMELKRESNSICQEHFLETPHLPFLFTHENNSIGLDLPIPGLPLSCSYDNGHRKTGISKTIFYPVTKKSFQTKDLPIFIRVRSLRN